MEKNNTEKKAEIKKKTKVMKKNKVPSQNVDHEQFKEIVETGKQESLGDFLEKFNANNQENHLTFIDGVLVTRRIYDMILKKYLTDENGEPEKGIYNGHSYDYLGIIKDEITDLLLDQVLEHGYFKNRGYQLINQFGINI